MEGPVRRRFRAGRRGAHGLLALLVLLVGARAASGSEPEVEFLAPRHMATVLGPSSIELRVRIPEGAKIERLDLRVDGRPHATLTAPPWKAPWNAGDGAAGHDLEAELRLADGRSARAAVRTSRLRVDQVEEVDLVNLYALALDRRGEYVVDLPREAFRILENGRPQQLERFGTERRPLRVALVLDTSGSMEGRKIERAKEAALDFLEVLQPGDEGMVVTFDNTVRTLQPLASDRPSLSRAIEAAHAEGGTALYDAVWHAAKALREFDGRRVIVLLSDGRDEADNGLEPGSLHTIGEALDQALRFEVMIFAVGLGHDLDGQLDFHRRETLEQILRRFAESTGGRAFISPGAGRLRRAFGAIADDLRHQYAIAYVSNDPTRDGKWREILVTTPGRDLEIVTRKGYYATPYERSR